MKNLKDTLHTSCLRVGGDLKLIMITETIGRKGGGEESSDRVLYVTDVSWCRRYAPLETEISHLAKSTGVHIGFLRAPFRNVPNACHRFHRRRPNGRVWARDRRIECKTHSGPWRKIVLSNWKMTKTCTIQVKTTGLKASSTNVGVEARRRLNNRTAERKRR